MTIEGRQELRTGRRTRRSGAEVAIPSPGEVTVVDDFLDPEEIDLALADLDLAVWRPSMTYMLQEDGARRDVLSPLRVSETAQQSWFTDDLQRLLAKIERRIMASIPLDPARLEYWQATNYPRGGRFFYHLDAGYWDDHYAGDRVFSFLIHLKTPLRGGGTHFRAIDRHVEARAGRLVVWDNLFANGDCNYRMIHSSEPLIRGEKTTLITWLRQKTFRIDNRR